MSNPRRKRIPLPQNLTPEEFICFCIAIPNDVEHWEAFWGALQLLANRRTWGIPLTAQSEEIADYWRAIIEENRSTFDMQINCGCPTPTNTRITAEGILEVSYDGGDTWERDPNDQRFSGTIFPPPPTPPGDATKCNTAEAGRIAIKIISDQILADGDLWVAVEGLIAAVCGILTTVLSVPGAGACAVIAATILAITQLGRAIISAALTEDVWDRFMCNLYCNNEANGSFTETGWQAVKFQITQDETGAAEAWLYWIANALGPVGLTNAAWSSHGAVGDCSECDCIECSENPILEDGQNLVDLGGGRWSITSLPHETLGNYAAIRFSTPAADCCGLGAQVVVAGFVSNYQAIQCGVGLVGGGYPIPNLPGGFAVAGWIHASSPFTIEFETAPPAP